jgi:hypothetical protein
MSVDDEPEIIDPRSLVEQAADLRQLRAQDRMRAIAVGIVASGRGRMGTA